MSAIDRTTDPGIAVSPLDERDATATGLAKRIEELRHLLERGRRDARPSVFARTDRVLAVAGATALPLGFVAIFLGWYGASRTPFLFEQVPYLISGGLLGVGLVLAGGLLFFGSWFARLAEQDRIASQDLVDALTDLHDAVIEQAQAFATATTHAGTGAAAPSAGGFRTLVATPTGAMAHRPECSVVASRDDLVTVPLPAEGYRPCKMCEPDLVEAAYVTDRSWRP